MSVDGHSVELTSGDRVSYSIQRREVQNPRLKLNPDGTLVAIAPDETPVPPIVASNREWISEQYRRQREELDSITRRYGNLTEGMALWGSAYQLETLEGEYDITLQGRTLRVRTPNDERPIPYLRRMVRVAIREAVQTLANSFCGETGIEFDSLSIRNQRTKWASCSTNSALSFNMRCAALPFDHLRYLVAHEVAHLHHPDHTEEFWGEVERLVPSYQQLRSELQGFWYVIHRNKIWCLLSD